MFLFSEIERQTLKSSAKTLIIAEKTDTIKINTSKGDSKVTLVQIRQFHHYKIVIFFRHVLYNNASRCSVRDGLPQNLLSYVSTENYIIEDDRQVQFSYD